MRQLNDSFKAAIQVDPKTLRSIPLPKRMRTNALITKLESPLSTITSRGEPQCVPNLTQSAGIVLQSGDLEKVMIAAGSEESVGDAGVDGSPVHFPDRVFRFSPEHSKATVGNTGCGRNASSEILPKVSVDSTGFGRNASAVILAGDCLTKSPSQKSTTPTHSLTMHDESYHTSSSLERVPSRLVLVRSSTKSLTHSRHPQKSFIRHNIGDQFSPYNILKRMDTKQAELLARHSPQRRFAVRRSTLHRESVTYKQ